MIRFLTENKKSVFSIRLFAPRSLHTSQKKNKRPNFTCRKMLPERKQLRTQALQMCEWERHMRKLVTHNNNKHATASLPSRQKRACSSSSLIKLRRTIRNPPKTRALSSTICHEVSGLVCVCSTQTVFLEHVATKSIWKTMCDAKHDFFVLVQPFVLVCFMRTDENGACSSSRSRFHCSVRGLLQSAAEAAKTDLKKEKGDDSAFEAYELALTNAMHASLIAFCDSLRSDNSSAFVEILLHRLSSITSPVFDLDDPLNASKTSSPLLCSSISPKRISNPFPAALAEALN